VFSSLHLQIARRRHQDMLTRVERRRIANVRDDTAKRPERPAETDRVPPTPSRYVERRTAVDEAEVAPVREAA
jgi:hypothetical protein